MSDLETNLNKVREQLQQACIASHRDANQITLLAVSKTRSAAEIEEMYNLGQTDFGENYLQEALEKKQALTNLDINWHFIGAIQSRKCADIAQNFTWVHSVDRLKVAEKLSQNASRNIHICIQVNIDNELSKSGVHTNELTSLIKAAMALPYIRVRGLMVIPSPEHVAHSPNAFERANNLLEQLNSEIPELNLDTLSMGMSNDMGEAVAAGSTCLRIGTALFGPRPQKEKS